MTQQTLAMAADDNAQFEQYRRPTRRDAFLATMEQIVPWAALCEVIEPCYPKADLSNQRVRKGSATEEIERMVNRAKSRVRARVEHVFGVVKRFWGFDKVRCRGLAKNATRSFVALGLANIYLARGALYGQVRP